MNRRLSGTLAVSGFTAGFVAITSSSSFPAVVAFIVSAIGAYLIQEPY